MASLGKFLSVSSKKGLPLFRLLRKKRYKWSPEYDKAFKKIKLARPPKANDALLLYMSRSKDSVAILLLREENKERLPVYFASRVLQGVTPIYQFGERGLSDRHHIKEASTVLSRPLN